MPPWAKRLGLQHLCGKNTIQLTIYRKEEMKNCLFCEESQNKTEGLRRLWSLENTSMKGECTKYNMDLTRHSIIYNESI